MRKLLSWLGALALVALVAGGVALAMLLKRGVSARAEPWAAEARIARRLRHLATPSEARARENPVPRTEEIVARGRAHFADHCAVCHGNDGSGDTAKQIAAKSAEINRVELESVHRVFFRRVRRVLGENP